MSEKDWPVLPFAITDGIPLSVCIGYNLAGVRESANSYLAYCIAYGTIRKTRLVLADRHMATNALNTIFGSPAWKRLKWEDSGPGWHFRYDEGQAKELLWKQVLNIAQTNSANRK